MPDDKTPQAPAKKAGRSRRWIYYLVFVIVVVVVALYFTGHLPGTGEKGGNTTTTSAPPVGSGFLAVTPSSVIFIQWNQTGTTAAGVAQYATVQGDPPAQTMTVKTIPVTGVIDGSNASVDFEGIVEVFGTTSDGGFVLDFPQPDGSLAPVAFRKASAQDYNAALAALRAQIDSANAGSAFDDREYVGRRTDGS